MRFHHAIQLRVEAFIQQKRQVILVGDINVVHMPIDHCDPQRSMSDLGISDFQATPARQWLDKFLAPKGPMTDTFRYFHPSTAQAFTVWNTLVNAREANFGTRIDMILVTSGLVPMMRDSRILADIMGSDHAPIVAEMDLGDFHIGVPKPSENHPKIKPSA
eukprot:jgi/Hompol1/5362/HPOL_000407-RA